MKRSLLCGGMLLAAIFVCGQAWGAEEKKYYFPVAYEQAGGEPYFLMKKLDQEKIEPLNVGESENRDDIVFEKLKFEGYSFITKNKFVFIDCEEFSAYLLLFANKKEVEGYDYKWYLFEGLKTAMQEEWAKKEWTLRNGSKGDLLTKTKELVAENCVILKCLYRCIDNTDLLGVFLSEEKEHQYFTLCADPVLMTQYSIDSYGKKLKDEWLRLNYHESLDCFFCRAFVFAWDKNVHEKTNILWFKFDDIVEAKTEKYKLDSWTIEGEKISKSVQKEINFTTCQALYNIAEIFKKEGLEAARQKEQERLAAEEEKKKQEELKKKSGGEKQEEKDPVIPLAESLKRLSEKSEKLGK